jgi:DNA polymerase sigma
MKSTKGRLILKELFVANIPKDITLIKQEESNKIKDLTKKVRDESKKKIKEESNKNIETPVVHKDVKKFLEANRKEKTSFVYTLPRSLTPNSKRLLEKYYLISTTKKIKTDEKRVMRL